MILRRRKTYPPRKSAVTRGPFLTIATALFMAGCAPAISSGDTAECSAGETATAIIGARTAFNRAILEGDMNAIASALSDEVVLITGTDSDIYQGREAQVALWQSELNDPARLMCERTPQCIRPSPLYPIASEAGSWRCYANGDEENNVTGEYSAKWRQTAGDWRVEAETFTTTGCIGTFCPPHSESDE